MHRNLFGTVTYKCGHQRSEILGSKNGIADFIGDSPKDASKSILSIARNRAKASDCPLCADIRRTVNRINTLAELDGLTLRFDLVDGKIVVLEGGEEKI